MTKKQEWASFEERVRAIASHIWNRPCKPGRVGGVNVDGISKLDSEVHCYVEITTERDLSKVREDIIKLSTAKSAAFHEGVMARCFCVVNGEITQAMKEAAAPNKIHVLSLSDFSRQFFDFNSYLHARLNSTFGSAINPLTGLADDTKYVPVRYNVEGKKSDISSSDVADYLRNGKNVILLGEYGSGKSRCISEVFKYLSEIHDKDFCHPMAIDLRKCWGLSEASELIRRHLKDLGLDGIEGSAIRAFNAKSIIFLLDGFDEIGSQAWSNDVSKLKIIRSKSLAGVRDIVQRNLGGTLVAGREHYFPSSDEMYSALGFDRRNTIVIRSKNEFSETELLEYFQNRDIDVDVPTWLPKRPLICQTIGELASDELEGMFGDDGDEIAFWNHFIDVLCKRDASIHVSFDHQTIFGIFVQLARLTRTKSADVGPISLGDLQEAFEIVTGAAPVEEASVMLQRLPSLGRVGAESNDRQFVDIYILDGLRARDIARVGDLGEAGMIEAAAAKWTNPLDDLGQRVLSRNKQLSEGGKLSLAKLAVQHGNSVLASDIVASMVRNLEGTAEFQGLKVSGGDFRVLAMDERPIRDLSIESSFFSELALPAKDCKFVKIEGSAAVRVTGVSSSSALPNWIVGLTVEEFDSVASVSRIRKIGLKPSHEILITVIRKTFFQKGSGRKEEALLRGLGKLATKSLSSKILNILIRDGLLTTFKGDEGYVYSPVRSHAQRMQRILNELNASKDPLWVEVAALN